MEAIEARVQEDCATASSKTVASAAKASICGETGLG